MRAISILVVQLDSSYYSMLAHLLSFLGIENEVTLVFNNETWPLVDQSFRMALPKSI